MDAEQLLMDNGYEGVKYLTDYSYDTAIIGVTDDNRVVYDFGRMVAWLVNEKRMEAEDAVEWIEYNTIRAIPYMGEGAPIVMYPLEVPSDG